MLLKKTNTSRSVFKNGLSFIKKKRVLVGTTLFIIYTILILGMGYALQRHHFYGQFLKPVLFKNFRLVGAYFKSFSVDREKLSIDIKHEDYLKLVYKRQEALELGSLVPSEEDWVPTIVRHNGKPIKADIRLKGIGSEHWEDENAWSLKLKIKGSDTLFGMKRFALNRPATRSFMNEWYWHKLLRYSGLIALRYDFIDVAINGRELPVYAVEENFEKRLIENNQLREGPIFRINFTPSSYSRLRKNFNYFAKAIDLYQSNKYSQNVEFMKLVYTAESRVEAYRQGDLPLFKVFDVNKMGKLLALTDLVQSRHTLPESNLRFYYNPVTKFIEPIAYDVTIPMSRTPQFNLIGKGSRFLDQQNVDSNSTQSIKVLRDNTWPTVLFRDKKLFKKYIESLEEISDKDFLDRFFLNNDEEAEEKKSILFRSFPYYKFDKNKFYENSEHIKKRLQPLKSLNIYFEGASREKGVLYLDIANILSLPVEILWVSLDGNNVIQPMQENVVQAKRVKRDIYGGFVTDFKPALPSLKSFKEDVLREVKTLMNHLPIVSENETKINQKLKSEELSGLEYKRVKFRIPRELEWTDDLIPRLRVVSRIFGAKSKTSNEIIPWARHEDMFLQPSNIKEISFMLVEEKKKLITISPGEWTVNQDIMIPAGYRVIAGQGTRLNLIQGAKILSYSAIEFLGSEEQPIVISSEENSGQGIIVIGAKDKSIIQHTIFDRLNNPSQEGWALTGAVTFYESPVVFSNVEFSNIQSEDGLNIIRSEFTLEDVIFRNMLSDGLDSDFSNGLIKNVSFLNCGNDGLDASGSDIHVESIFFNLIGDKGISAGEKTRISIDKLDGKNSRIFVASKDQSKVFIKKAKVKNSQIGFTAFQKKTEFGPGAIEVQVLETSNVETLFLIEEGSTLKIDGSPITARVKGVEKLLYGG
jgi:hypothetical protein